MSLHMLTYFYMYCALLRDKKWCKFEIPESASPPGNILAFQDSRSSLSLMIFRVHPH
jgi:hypothetical protein